MAIETWILLVYIFANAFVQPSEFPSFFDDDDLRDLGAKHHHATYVGPAVTGRYTEHPVGYRFVPKTEQNSYSNKPPNALPIHEPPRSDPFSPRPLLKPAARGDPRYQNGLRQDEEAAIDQPFPEDDGKGLGNGDAKNLVLLPERLEKTHKWDEFKQIMAEEHKKHPPGEVMENWEDDAHRWAGYSKHLLEREEHEKEQKKNYINPPPPPIRSEPSAGLEPYWGEAEIAKPQLRNQQDQGYQGSQGYESYQGYQGYPGYPETQDAQMWGQMRRQMFDSTDEVRNPGEFGENLDGPIKHNQPFPPIYYKKDFPEERGSTREGNGMPSGNAMYPGQGKFGMPSNLNEMAKYLPPMPKNNFRLGPEREPREDLASGYKQLGKSGRNPGPGSEKDYPDGYLPDYKKAQELISQFEKLHGINNGPSADGYPMRPGMGSGSSGGGYPMNPDMGSGSPGGGYPMALRSGRGHPMSTVKVPGPPGSVYPIKTGTNSNPSEGGNPMFIGRIPEPPPKEKTLQSRPSLRDSGEYAGMDDEHDFLDEDPGFRPALRMGGMPGGYQGPESVPAGPGSEGAFPEGYRPNVAGGQMGLEAEGRPQLRGQPTMGGHRPARGRPPMGGNSFGQMPGGGSPGQMPGGGSPGQMPGGGFPGQMPGGGFPGQMPGGGFPGQMPGGAEYPAEYGAGGQGHPGQDVVMTPRRGPTGRQLFLIAKKKVAAMNRYQNITVTMRSVMPTTERQLTKEERLAALRQYDDFHAPIRWVPFNSPDTSEGLAKVTDRNTTKNEQYVIEGELYVPIIDDSMARLGWTTEDPAALTTMPPYIPPNDSAIKVVLRTMDFNTTDDREWLVYETVLGAKKRYGKECNDESCQARCYTTGCDAICKGDTCATGCVGVSCNGVCKGPGCFSMCVGDQCTAKCEGLNCETRCWGKSCESSCSSFSCQATINGVDSPRNNSGSWDQMYPQYGHSGNPDVYPGQQNERQPQPPPPSNDEYYAD